MVWNQKPYKIPSTTTLGVYIFQQHKAMNLETVNKYTNKVNKLKPKRNVVTKSMIKKDELIAAIELQREKKDFIRSV